MYDECTWEFGVECWVFAPIPRITRSIFLMIRREENCMLTECKPSELSSIRIIFSQEIPEFLDVQLAASSRRASSVMGGCSLENYAWEL